jgi:hypothetical protein
VRWRVDRLSNVMKRKKKRKLEWWSARKFEGFRDGSSDD